jgi:hypothetical protein
VEGCGSRLHLVLHVEPSPVLTFGVVTDADDAAVVKPDEPALVEAALPYQVLPDPPVVDVARFPAWFGHGVAAK